MDFAYALKEIQTFWKKEPIPFEGGGKAEVERIQALFKPAFPAELMEYIDKIIPSDWFDFTTVGNPISLYGFPQISNRLEGYSYDAVTLEELEDWNKNWLLIADEGGDPIIIDLNKQLNSFDSCAIYQAEHGAGVWEFVQIADSIPQFLLLAACQHHALEGFGLDEPITDDEHGFRLKRKPAQWLFPKVKKYAPTYYDFWLQAFDNR